VSHINGRERRRVNNGYDDQGLERSHRAARRGDWLALNGGPPTWAGAARPGERSEPALNRGYPAPGGFAALLRRYGAEPVGLAPGAGEGDGGSAAHRLLARAFALGLKVVEVRRPPAGGGGHGG
jgi:hypothetical protein